MHCDAYYYIKLCLYYPSLAEISIKENLSLASLVMPSFTGVMISWAQKQKDWTRILNAEAGQGFDIVLGLDECQGNSLLGRLGVLMNNEPSLDRLLQ